MKKEDEAQKQMEDELLKSLNMLAAVMNKKVKKRSIISKMFEKVAIFFGKLLFRGK